MKIKLISITLGLAALLMVNTSFAATTKTKDNGYTVHTIVEGRDATVAYNHKGEWVYTIQQFNMDNLDKQLIDKIKTVFDKYTITGIQKIEQPGYSDVYIAYLENASSYKTISISNDEVSLLQDIEKI